MTKEHEEEIEKIVYGSNNVIRDITDWVIADRKRIVEPLVAYKLSVLEVEQNWGLKKSDKVINKVLKLAGVSDERI